MAKGRSRREEAEHWLQVRAREGLTYREISERSGIPICTLTGWNRRLKREQGDAEIGQHPFVELRAAQPEATPSSSDVIMTLRFASGHTMEVHSAATADQILPALIALGLRC